MDKYDAEIERLVVRDMYALLWCWQNSGPLFQRIANDCGCLTQVRGGNYTKSGVRGANAVIESVRRDERIPKSLPCITKAVPNIPEFNDWDSWTTERRREMLTRFANWQRALDSTIRQGKPWHPEFAPPKEPAKESTKSDLTICANKPTIQPTLA